MNNLPALTSAAWLMAHPERTGMHVICAVSAMNDLIKLVMGRDYRYYFSCAGRCDRCPFNLTYRDGEWKASSPELTAQTQQSQPAKDEL